MSKKIMMNGPIKIGAYAFAHAATDNGETWMLVQSRNKGDDVWKNHCIECNKPVDSTKAPVWICLDDDSVMHEECTEREYDVFNG